MKLAVQMALLAAAGSALGLAANSLSPRPAHPEHPVYAAAESGGGAACSAPPGPSAAVAPLRSPRVDIQEAKGLCQACLAAFVDARGAADFAQGHIANAVHLPPAGHPDEARVIAWLRTHPLVVVYDGDYTCALADDVAGRLRRAGLPDVRVLQGAWTAWVAAGGPAAAGACGTCGFAEAHK
jgi:3-mercaptopyruvate sulfurtransferase SseA